MEQCHCLRAVPAVPGVPILEWRPTCEKIWNLLKQHEVWWEPGLAKTIIDGSARPLEPVYFRILIDQITGHHAALGGGEDDLAQVSRLWL
jgi:hypothetical protein